MLSRYMTEVVGFNEGDVFRVGDGPDCEYEGVVYLRSGRVVLFCDGFTVHIDDSGRTMINKDGKWF